MSEKPPDDKDLYARRFAALRKMIETGDVPDPELIPGLADDYKAPESIEDHPQNDYKAPESIEHVSDHPQKGSLAEKYKDLDPEARLTHADQTAERDEDENGQ